MTDATLCRSCNAPIRFGLTAKAKRMPLDLEPVNASLAGWVITDAVGEMPALLRGLQVFDGRLRQATLEDVREGRELFRPHFATCPNASVHRRR